MVATPTLRLGYLVPEFPAQTHVFFWREARELEALGVDLRWLSTRRPFAACPHAFGPAAAASTHYVFPPRFSMALASLLRSPRGGARCLSYLAGLRESPLGQRARRLGLIACAADLAGFASRQRLAHLHVHSCAEAAHLAALAARLTGLSYSLTLHGDLPVYGRDHAAKMADARFVSVVTRDLQKQVTSVIGLPAHRVPVVRMGVDVGLFTPAPRNQAAGTGFHVVTVARLAEVKGHRFALRALRSLIDDGLDAVYTIAGDGPDRAVIQHEADNLGLSGRVRFAGSLNEVDVLGLLRTADAFVLPSVGLGEAAPVAVMEAMSTGIPVVCSIIGGVPELVEDGAEGFLVPQGRAEAIAVALKRLADDTPLRRRMSEAGRARAVSEFSARASAGKLLEAIREGLRRGVSADWNPPADAREPGAGSG
jgi:colanic acid/amylovoran biosynthesis glycosyltransferase